MKVRAFVKAVGRYCRKGHREFEYDPSKGDGSHGAVRVDARFHVILGMEAIMSKKLVRKICKALGVPLEEVMPDGDLPPSPESCPGGQPEFDELQNFGDD